MSIFLFLSMDTLELSMDDVVKLALNNNLYLKSVKEEVKGARYGVLKAFSNFLPKTEIKAGFTKLSDVPIMEMPVIDSFIIKGPGNIVPVMHFDTISMGSENNYSVELSFSQPLFTGGKILNGWIIAKKNFRMERLKETLVVKTMEYKVKEIYVYALVAREFWLLSKKVEEELRSHYETAKKRYEEGYATELELLQAEVSYRSQKARTEEAYCNYQKLLDNLKVITGIPMEREILLVDSLSEKIEKTDTLFSVENRYDLRIMRIQKEMLEHRKQIALVQSLPNVFTGFSYSYKKPFGFKDEWRGTWAFTIGFSLPFFNGGKNFAEVKRIDSEIKRMMFLIDEKEKSVEKEARIRIRNYRYANTMVKIAKKNLTVAEKLYNTAKKQYEEGSATHLEFIDAETNYALKRAEYIKALGDLFVAQIKLEELKTGIFEQGGM